MKESLSALSGPVFEKFINKNARKCQENEFLFFQASSQGTASSQAHVKTKHSNSLRPNKWLVQATGLQKKDFSKLMFFFQECCIEIINVTRGALKWFSLYRCCQFTAKVVWGLVWQVLERARTKRELWEKRHVTLGQDLVLSLPWHIPHYGLTHITSTRYYFHHLKEIWQINYFVYICGIHVGANRGVAELL